MSHLTIYPTLVSHNWLEMLEQTRHCEAQYDIAGMTGASFNCDPCSQTSIAGEGPITHSPVCRGTAPYRV